MGSSSTCRFPKAWLRVGVCALCVLSAMAMAPECFGYSVVMHQAIVDAEWEQCIKPRLLARFPQATPQELRLAKSYAYGGSVIQDMGYYPLCRHFFSHLTHYARSGDFVTALLADSRNLNDYAFALGALSHYCADNQGHSLGVNLSVPLLYPRLRRRYGNVVTWEDSPSAHVLTEFGFDTLEVVAGHVAPLKYHRAVGFRVPEPLLRRAFRETYGLELPRQVLSLRIALWSYRNLAGRFVPDMTKVAWAMRRKSLEQLAFSAPHRQLYHLRRVADGQYRHTRPGPGDYLLAGFVRIVPKVGPLSVFQFHTPTVDTERLFANSLRATINDYEHQVNTLPQDPPDTNLDTGRPTRPGEYHYCDLTYAQLLHKLARTHFAHLSPELSHNIVAFYQEAQSSGEVKKTRHWRRIQRELKSLQSAPGAHT